jgi:UDP-N-acetylmuramoylalanine--D-glutamate ligase
MDAPPRRVLVVGLGRSGAAACSLARALQLRTAAYDARPDAVAPVGVEAYVGESEIPAAALLDVDLVVLSPGVPPGPVHARVAQHAPEARVLGELSFALATVQRRAPSTEVVAITGTNGKSTITALTGALIRAGGRRCFVGGNLGPPLAEHMAEVVHGLLPMPQVLVLECSSFQLETLPASSPIDVAILCNATEDHVDRYRDFDHYVQTKARVFAGLREQGLALIGADPALAALVPAGRFTTRIVGGEATPRVTHGPEGVSLALDDSRSISRDALRLAGAHNGTNALFALAAAAHLDALPDEVEPVLRGFEGLPHRMQWVATVGDIAYYDDSKATNIASVVAGLTGFERPFVLLAGGRLKGDEVEPMRTVLSQPQARGVVGFGEGGDTIVALAPSGLPTLRAERLDEALEHARTLAMPGDAVVLSPGGSSYDAYPNFVARGEHFVQLVRRHEDAG